MSKSRQEINQIFKIFASIRPNPSIELTYTNHFTLLVAVILSAQATDVSVNKATNSLFAKYDTPRQFLLLGSDKLKPYIKNIGLSNVKAKNIIALCHILVNKYNSQIPASFDELIQLPGVGSKTANVILNCAFGLPTIAVDTHVYRVSRRIGLSDGNTVEQVANDLLKAIPAKYHLHAHHWLVLHGRYTCKARKPLCCNCPITQYCNYFQTNKINDYRII